MPLSAGTKLGPYEIVAPIGAGGMGEVYKARDTRLGRDVAVKVLPAELAGDTERVARFEREARALASLEHPNILAIYDVGGQAGTVYVVTELLRGESLDRRLDSGPLRLAEAVDVASQAAAGLAAAHDKGIVHRDLKPANLFVLQDGRVKVLDFGLALMLPPPQEPGRDREATTRDVLTASHVIMGTMGYLSPEQVRFHRGDARSDVFAFGCVFYEMVTGRTPFQGETPTDALVAVLTQEPRPPSSLQPGIPRALEGIILRCLEKEPGKRFASARELSAELERIRIPDGTKTRRRPARMRTLAWILIAIAAAALAAALYLLPSPWRTDQGSASRAPEPQPAVPMPPTAPRWKDSVAVLPFTNLSAAPEQEYFCDGMTEQVIADLTRVPDLKVIARTSVMTYKHTDKDVRQIARELGVAHVLEGSVRRSGGRIRVTAQLIRAEDGSHVWSREYDRRTQDVFAVQDEVAQAISEALRLTAGGGPFITAQEARPSHVEAYEWYLKGRHHAEDVYMVTHDVRDFRTALEYGEKAVALDPRYGLGYVGLVATCENYLIVTADRSIFKQQLTYARKAYESDPGSALACAVYGVALSRQDRCEEGFDLARRGLGLNPNEPLVWLCAGAILVDLGLAEDAVACHQRTVELDPRNYFAYYDLGAEYLLWGRAEDAMRAFARVLELQPAEPEAVLGNAFACLLAGKLPEADQEIAKEERLPDKGAEARSLRAIYHASLGERDRALALSGPGYDFLIYALLGMNDEAVAAIQAGIRDNDREPSPIDRNQLLYYLPLAHWRWYDNLRADPRFQKILATQRVAYDGARRKYALKGHALR